MDKRSVVPFLLLLPVIAGLAIVRGMGSERYVAQMDSGSATRPAPGGEGTAKLVEEVLVNKLEAMAVAQGAEATVAVRCGEKGGPLAFIAKGLKPGGVYTVWFVDDGADAMAMAGVGKAPYSFVADRDGEAVFTADLKSDPTATWRRLVIAYHPNDDPKDMPSHQDALSCPLKVDARLASGRYRAGAASRSARGSAPLACRAAG